MWATFKKLNVLLGNMMRINLWTNNEEYWDRLFLFVSDYKDRRRRGSMDDNVILNRRYNKYFGYMYVSAWSTIYSDYEIDNIQDVVRIGGVWMKLIPGLCGFQPLESFILPPDMTKNKL